MSQASATTAQRPVSRSRPYLWLLWLIPALAMLGTGLYFQYNVPEGGDVTTIRLTTKSGMVGQAAETVANIDPSTPDLYLKVTVPSGEVELPVMKNTPIGNGLEWKLPTTMPLADVQRVDVFDYRWITKDKQLDRITLNGWSVDGQRFHVDLLGQRHEPPKWAVPVAIAGGVVTLLVLLKFVWDQVI